MTVIDRFFQSFIFWGAWIIIPVLMEIIPSFGGFFLLLSRRIKMRKDYKKPALYPELSIIIPVYNSEDTLLNCIRSVDESTYPNERIRIFLVNNHGQDDSFFVFSEAQKRWKTRSQNRRQRQTAGRGVCAGRLRQTAVPARRRSG